MLTCSFGCVKTVSTGTQSLADPVFDLSYFLLFLGFNGLGSVVAVAALGRHGRLLEDLAYCVDDWLLYFGQLGLGGGPGPPDERLRLSYGNEVARPARHLLRLGLSRISTYKFCSLTAVIPLSRGASCARVADVLAQPVALDVVVLGTVVRTADVHVEDVVHRLLVERCKDAVERGSVVL